MANTFNNFFTTIAENLVSKLPDISGGFGGSFIDNYYQNKGVKSNAFIFSPVSEDVISKLIGNLSIRKATGLDGLSARFLKDGESVISSPLSHIINLSLRLGCVPDEMKTARVIPLYKKKSKTDPGNYRPVSILTIVSKILERVTYNQIESYMKSENLFYSFQSGFRSSFSTDTCLTHLTDQIRFQMDRGFYTGMVMIDLQKAFDTVDHDILLQKLKALGFDPLAIKWFESYLKGRNQKTEINGIFSDPRVVPCGVPQGSILGPLLFLLYINDMEAAVSCQLILYADDSALLVSGKDVNKIEQQLGNELSSLNGWLVDNRLSIHLGKTESILFGTKKRLGISSEMNVTCGETMVASTKSVRYLGVDLDQSLDGNYIAENILKKGNSRLKFLWRHAKFLNTNSRKLLASALIQCHFDYACSAWFSGLQKIYQQKLQILQNKTIRFVLNCSPRTHIGFYEFKIINWIPVSERVKQIKLNNMFRIIHGTAPKYLRDSFFMVSQEHDRYTRTSVQSLVLPHVKSAGAKSFRYSASKMWNRLPVHLRMQENFLTFKHAVRKHMWTELQRHEDGVYIYY